MLSIIFALFLALILALFATQNTGEVLIKMLPFTFFSIPTYILIIASMIVGLLIGSIFQVTNSINSWLIMRRKDMLIKNSQNANNNKDKVIKNLEEENSRLKDNETISSTPRFSI